MSETTKVCTGPAHAQPTNVPLDEQHWHFYRSGERAGKSLARCKLCRHWDVLIVKRGPHGLVDVESVRVFVDELIDRCGSPSAVERLHGITANALRLIERGETMRVQKSTVARVLSALAAQRREDRRNGSSARFNATRRQQAMRVERLERLAGY